MKYNSIQKETTYADSQDSQELSLFTKLQIVQSYYYPGGQGMIVDKNGRRKHC